MKNIFKVKEVVNGNTIVVTPDWRIGRYSGDKVVVIGYVPEFKELPVKSEVPDEGWRQFADEYAKLRLERLLMERLVVLKTPQYAIADCIDTSGKGYFNVFLNAVDISYYFHDYKR